MDAAYLIGLAAGVATTVSAVTAVGVVIAKRIRGIHEQNSEQLRQQAEQLRKQSEFNIDWYGQAARPGVAAQPGMMERVANIEKELRPNGGGSLRDSSDRIESRLIEQDRRITNIENRQPPQPEKGNS